MELRITWDRAVRIWWALTWRGLIVAVATTIVTFCIGFVLGFSLHIAGVTKETIQILSGIVGFGVGLTASVIPVWWVLGRDYGEYRLVLVSNRPNPQD